MKLKRKLTKLLMTGEIIGTSIALNYAEVLAAKGKKGKDISAVTDGIETLKTLVLSAIGGVGVIFLAWGLMDFGTAYSAHDSSQQMQGIKKVIGGLIIIAVPTLIGILS